MPAFIDAHRHVNAGDDEKAQMQALLDAGYTRYCRAAAPRRANIALRESHRVRRDRGPRIIPSGRVDLAANTA